MVQMKRKWHFGFFFGVYKIGVGLCGLDHSAFFQHFLKSWQLQLDCHVLPLIGSWPRGWLASLFFGSLDIILLLWGLCSINKPRINFLAFL